jgi:hypothetical protein
MSKLSKEQIAKLLAKELTELTREKLPAIHRAIIVHAPAEPKVEKAQKPSTANGRVSKGDVLDIKKQILASWGRI